jgi:hypothetical protein
MAASTVTKNGRYGKPVTHIKDNAPRHIACYVSKKALNKGMADAWTVIFTRVSNWQLSKDAPDWLKAAYLGKVLYIGMTQSGAYYHGEADNTRFYPGTKISFKDLNEAQRKVVIEEYEECWRIKIELTCEYLPVDWELDCTKEA